MTYSYYGCLFSGALCKNLLNLLERKQKMNQHPTDTKTSNTTKNYTWHQTDIFEIILQSQFLSIKFYATARFHFSFGAE